MTWNIRRRIPGPLARPVDRWDQRAPRIAMVLQEQAPSLLGIQEALPEQVDFLRATLADTHGVVGQGRGRGHTGEASPIIYDTRHLQLLGWRQQALSNTPDKPGSVSWGNIFPRALVAAVFREHASGSRFLVINTHLDHLSARSRLRSAGVIRQIITDSGLPAIVTGDFNASQRSRTHWALLEDNLLRDTWDEAHHHLSEDWGTFPNYRPPVRGGRRLDWILGSPDWTVHGTGINARQYDGAWASDHLSVHAFMIPPGQAGDTTYNDRQFHPPTEGFQ